MNPERKNRMNHRSFNSFLRRALACALSVLFISFSFLPALAADKPVRAGDIDGDGSVTSADARIALRLAVELSIAPSGIRPYADANGDYEVNAEDARLILRAAVGLEDGNGFASFYPENVSKGAEISFWNKTEMETLELAEKESFTVPQDFVQRVGAQYAWASSNPAVAVVSDAGVITGKAKGFACISLTDGNARYYYFVHVLSALQQKIYALAEKYPHGYYWNAHEKSKKYPAVSEIPCSDHRKGNKYCIGQCAGFALLMSNEVFGKNAPLYKIPSVDAIKIGDDVRCRRNNPHSVFVIDKVNKGEICGYDIYSDKNYTAQSATITVVECNWDGKCGIKWGREISLDELQIEPAYSYSRYK